MLFSWIYTLNSNLILLILMAGVVSVLTSVAFKFQSDSINTMEILQGLLFGILFKFQSDSINTLKTACREGVNQTLNSNLILLIRTNRNRCLCIVQNTLNSNLILLIHWSGLTRSSLLWIFKFQSDSINTQPFSKRQRMVLNL